MEEQLPAGSASGQNGEEFSLALERQRRQALEFIATHRRQFAEIEARLDDQIERLAESLSEVPDDDANDAPTPQRLAEIAAKTQSLETLRAELESLRGSLEDARSQMRDDQHLLVEQLEAHLARLQQRQTEIESASAGVSQERQQAAAVREQLQDESSELSRGRQRLETRLADLGKQEQSLAESRQRVKHQRRRMAQEFRQRQADLRQELERRRAEVEKLAEAGRHDFERMQAEARRRQTQLERSLDERTQALDSCRTELEEVRRTLSGAQHELQRLSAEKEKLHDELTASRAAAAAAEKRARESDEERKRSNRQLTEANEQRSEAVEAKARADDQLNRLQAQLAELKLQSAQAEAERAAAESQAARLHTLLSETKEAGLLAEEQRADLQVRGEQLARQLEHAKSEYKTLEELVAELQSHPRAAAEAGGGKGSDLERRLQMALDDLRGEKAKNAELHKKLAQSAAPIAAATGGSDWESQKRRLLESLEADGGEATQEMLVERLRIEDAIRATETVVAEKDREILELQNLLSEQSSNLGSMAVGAAAIAEILDNDDLVRQERENLERLQTEWRDKLRQAEIDLSVQRAKIARERAELEEKLRTYESQQASQDEMETTSGVKGRGAKSGRRWLSRLGLAEQGDEAKE